MKEISIAKAEAIADDLQNRRKEWHFHMLTPDFLLNKKKRHAFIIENTTDNETFVVYSSERHLDFGKKLVKFLHGDSILKKRAWKHSTENQTLKVILQKVKDLSARNIPWHHHLLFPKCIFNKNKGRWAIIFEDKESGNTLEAIYRYEPKSDLGHIEILYYDQKG
jgi:hypothetical protein